MDLGLFMMPLHRPHKPWAQALAEDREAVILADRLGFAEVWVGEHFTTKAEQIPSPLMFFASLIEAAPRIRFGTGVVNLPHHHPVVVAAEAAMLDQMSGGRIILGVGPGGLVSDGELFGHTDMGERYAIAMESIDVIRRIWSEEAPFRHEGRRFQLSLERNVWPDGGVGRFPRPLQKPHPPLAMAMVGPGGPTARYIAEQDFIPISANFVPLENAEAQWRDYAAAREAAGRPADPSVWRVCRNVVITGSREQARDLLEDPDGDLAFYFRYLRALRRLDEVRAAPDSSPPALNALLDVDGSIRECAVVGTADAVLERLVADVDRLGPFGTLVMVGHDWSGLDVHAQTMRTMAEQVMPRLGRHAAALSRRG
jgi:alkanesulfonate monooxygenase SsuD/methylene tetrahydromethanopterin reductase-like flavin-dependent oxidoreductase (luciferase family)